MSAALRTRRSAAAQRLAGLATLAAVLFATQACSRNYEEDPEDQEAIVDLLLEAGEHAEALRVIERDGLDATASGRRLKAEALILGGDIHGALDILQDESIEDRQVLIDDACVAGGLDGETAAGNSAVMTIVTRCREMLPPNRVDRAALELRALLGTPEYRCDRVLDFIRGSLDAAEPGPETDVAARIASETLSQGAQTGNPDDAVCLREAFALTGDVDLGRQYLDWILTKSREWMTASPQRARRCLDDFDAAVARGMPAPEADDLATIRAALADVEPDAASCVPNRVR